MPHTTKQRANPIRMGLLLTFLLTCLSGTVLAQDLASATPAGSLLAIGLWQETETAEALREDLAALDWESGLATISQLAESSGADEALEFLRGLITGESMSGAAGELEFCPELQELLSPDADHPSQANMLASIGFSPFNPMPAFTLLAELGQEHDELYADAVAALMDCSEALADLEFTSLDQDGTQFWQVTDDFDINFAFSNVDGVFALSTSVDQLRYVIRLQNGSDEPSLADSRLYGEWAALGRGGNGMDWFLDYSVIADLVEAFGPSLGAPELANQLAASFRSAGGSVGSLSLLDGELVYENLLLPDPEGGDTELIDLLLSRGLGLPETPIVPAGAVAVASQVVNAQGFVDYLQGWLDRVAPMLGEDLDLRDLLAEVDVDLDTALLDWIGNDVHVVHLETATAGVASLVRGPAQLALIGTRDPAAAEQGFLELLDLAAAFGELDMDEAFEIGVDVRQESYRGVDYTRIRMGPTGDFAAATLGSYLVLGMPAGSLHQGIDQFLDGDAASTWPGGPAGADLTQVTWLDAGAELASFRDLVSNLVQPVAWTTRMIALEEASSPDWDEWDYTSQDWSDGAVYGSLDLSSIVASPLTVGGTATSELEVFDTEESAVYFELQGLSAGDSFSVIMESAEFDTLLQLYELESGNQVAYNDDYDWYVSTDSQIDYVAQPDVTYLARATSWSWDVSGEFTLSLIVENEAAAEEEEAEETAQVPSFSQMLDLFDLIPQAIGVVADRTGELRGHQERRGDTLYTRYVLQADW